MKRRLVLQSFLAAIGAAGCDDLTRTAGHISQKIGDVASDPAATEVDLSKLTTFGWDRLYLFAPGTPKQEICEFIGTDAQFCDQIIRHQSLAGESMTLVFGLQERLTHAELHALSNGRFDLPPGRSGIPKEACVFRIRREHAADGRSILWLVPKTNADPSVRHREL